MKFSLTDSSKTKNPAALMRQAGYHPETKQGETSFIKAIHGAPFPRFHVYVNEMGSGWEINLHLDQKQPSYGGGRAHAGEYDGAIVEAEIARLRKIIS